MEEHTLVDGRRRPLLQVNPSRRSVLKAGAVGHIAPKTGPMAGFAEAQDWTLNGIRQILAPGLQIGGKTYKVEIVTKDSQTDESRTAEVASELILKDKVDSSPPPADRSIAIRRPMLPNSTKCPALRRTATRWLLAPTRNS